MKGQLRTWLRARNWRNTSKQYYYSIMKKMILIICITALVSGGIMTQVLVRNEIGKANTANGSELRLSASGIDDILYTLERESFLLSQSTTLNAILPKTDFSEDLGLSVALSNELMRCKNNNDMIEEIYFYNKNMAGIFSNKLGYVDSSSELYGNIEYLIGLDRPTGWAELPHMNTAEQLAFFRKVPMLKSSDPQGILVFYIRKQPLCNQLVRNPVFHRNASFVLDGEGRIILGKDAAERSPAELEALLSASLQTDFSQINEVHQSQVTVEGQPFLIAQMTTGYGRTYLSALERNGLLQDIGVVLFTIAVILVVTIGVGVVFAVFCSRQIYSPVEALVMRGMEKGVAAAGRKHEIEYLRECFDSLTRESETLNRHVIEIRSKLRQGLLTRLLDGSLLLDNTSVAECESFQIPTGCRYVALALGTGDNASLPGELLRALPGDGGHDLVRIGGQTALLRYFGKAESAEAIHAACRVLADDLVARMRESSGAALCVGIGRIAGGPGEISASYRDAVLSLNEHILGSGRRVFVAGDSPQGGEQPGDLSFVHESAEALLRCLEGNTPDGAGRELDRFIGTLFRTGSGSHVMQMMKLLLTDLLFLADNRSGVSITGLLQTDLFFTLDQCRTLEAARDWFVDTILGQLCEQYRASRQRDGIVPKVCGFIREHVFDDITLNGCAEYAGVTPAYLSKLFKKDMGVCFLDYVLACKIEEVKQLLWNTDLSINKIAERVRYSPRNLYRQFYKLTLLSPNEFRKARQEQ